MKTLSAWHEWLTTYEERGKADLAPLELYWT